MFELYNKIFVFHNNILESYSCHEDVAHKKKIFEKLKLN